METVLATFPILPFDLLVARVHARLWATLAASGDNVGAHDRMSQPPLWPPDGAWPPATRDISSRSRVWTSFRFEPPWLAERDRDRLCQDPALLALAGREAEVDLGV